LDEVVIKLTNPLEVAVDGLWRESSCHEKVDILGDCPWGDLLRWHLQP
jgi:hypothetical protein